MNDTTFNNLVLLRLITLCLLTLVYCPYCLWIFYKDRHESYVRKRRPLLIYSLVVLNIIISITETFLVSNTCFLPYCHHLPQEIGTLCIYITVAPMVTCLTSRIWFIYYDLKYGESIISHKWWSNVTNNTEQDWFIAHRGTYGSLKNYMRSRIIIFILIWMILICIFTFFTSYVITTIIVGFIPINTMAICMVTLFYRMPKTYDVLLIRKEVNLLTIFCGTSSIYFTLAKVVFSDIIGVAWFSAFYQQICTVIITAICILWPHYNKPLHYDRNNPNHNLLILNSSFSSNATVTTNTNTNTNTHSESVNTNTNTRTSERSINSSVNQQRSCLALDIWQQYVNNCDNDTNWNLFMIFLIKEINVENLCFILEVIQFKKQFISQNILNHINKQLKMHKYLIYHHTIGWFMNLPNKLPKSTIITDYDDYMKQVKYIYEKYIVVNSNLQINISGDTRCTFMKEMNEINSIYQNNNDIDDSVKDKLIKLFDNALNNVNDNLDGSFYRYKLMEWTEDAEDEDVVSAMMEAKTAQ